MEEVKKTLDLLQDQLNKAIAHLEIELQKVRAGKASPSMLEGLYVDYYGTPTPMNQVASVNTPDARTLIVQPWEKAMIKPIEKSIIDANIGFAPQNDGTMIRISIPPQTEERRKELVKKAKAEGEHAKVGIRTFRKDANDNVKKAQKNGLPEDMAKDAEDKIQKLIDSCIVKIDKHLEGKEKEIMTV